MVYVIKPLKDRFYNNSNTRFLTAGKIYMIKTKDVLGRICFLDDEKRDHSLSKNFLSPEEIVDFSNLPQEEKDLYLMLYPELEKEGL